MRTIGFYSFKGGVGRSNLVLNIASYLAGRGRHVGVLDLDLEAPGLTVAPPLRPPEGAGYPNKGLTDFFSEAARTLEAEDAEGEVPELLDIFYETRLGLESPGSVHLAPAVPLSSLHDGKTGFSGRISDIYQKFSRQMAAGPLIGPGIFKFAGAKIAEHEFSVTRGKKRISAKLDFLLVDLRTGLNELADSAIGFLATELMIVCGLNTQNRDGTTAALRSMEKTLKKRKAGPVRVTPVFSPIPNAELSLVRDRLRNVHKELLDMAERYNWLDLKSRLQLLLPLHPWEEETRSSGGLLTIHYCDYLAVGDDVLIEKYPETLAARELRGIAERFTLSIDEVTAETMRRLRESGLLQEAPSKDEGKDAWAWLPAAMREGLDWRWPLERFGTDPSQIDALADKLLEGFELREEGESFLNDLAATMSLDVEEKNRVMDAMKTPVEKQIQDLRRVFDEEREKFIDLARERHVEVGSHLCRRLAEWPLILKEAGFSLPAVSEQIASFRSTGTSGHIPPWAYLYGYMLTAPEAEEKAAAAYELLRNQDIPPALMVQALDKLPSDQTNSLGKRMASWWKKVQKHSFSASQLYSLGTDFIEKLDMAKEAEAAYKKAIALDEKWAYPWNGLGNVLQYLGRHKEAEEAYRKAIVLDEKFAYPWNGLGALLQDHLGRHKEAEAAYRKAISLDEKFAYPWSGLGNLLQNYLGRHEEAEAAYRKAISLDEKEAYPWNGLGDLLQEHLGRYEEAEAAYRRYLELAQGPDLAYGYYNYLRLLSFHLRDEEKYVLWSDRARAWARDALRRPVIGKVEVVHAALLALCGLEDVLDETLRLLAEKNLDRGDQLWLLILNDAPQISPSRTLADFEPREFYAVELEDAFRGLATLRDRISSAILKELTEWFAAAFEEAARRKGSDSRPPARSAIAPAAEVLGCEDILERLE